MTSSRTGFFVPTSLFTRFGKPMRWQNNMIIDAHTHIWDENYASKEYLEEALSHRKRVGDVDPAATKHWMPLPREAWVAELKEAGIEKAIVLAFDLTRVF